MSCMKVGSKADAFSRHGNDWFCTTGLQSDVVVRVGQVSFHLHKFPLISRSRVLERLISREGQGEDDGSCTTTTTAAATTTTTTTTVYLPDIPGGSKAFELVSRFCYSIKTELTVSNAVLLRCASEHLEMTEEFGENNLIKQTENFLDRVIFRNWKDSLDVLRSIDPVLPHAEELNIVNRCIHALASNLSTVGPNLSGWPVAQSLPRNALWNGISTGALPINDTARTDCWWYEDASTLSLPLFKRLISSLHLHGVGETESSAAASFYAKKYVCGLNRHPVPGDVGARRLPPRSEEEQRRLVEEIDALIPLRKGLIPVKFIFGLLRTGIILRADPSCISNLERRAGMQLHEAALDDLLIPNFSYTMETLYNVDCVHRVLDHFLATATADPTPPAGSPCRAHEERTVSTRMAKLIDDYLAEIASDSNLNLPKFKSLASSVPDTSRSIDDGLYRAIDIYLKAHSQTTEGDREELCRLMDCEKLSPDACAHAAQNERLPLRTIIQVLFFEQLRIRSSIGTGYVRFDASRQTGSDGSNEEGWTVTARENLVLRMGMDNMRMRVNELEKECSNMKKEIEKLGGGRGGSATTRWGTVTKKLGFRVKSQICSSGAHDASLTLRDHAALHKSHKVATSHDASQCRAHM